MVSITLMALASITFHLMYYLILKERGEKYRIGIKSVVSLMTYTLAAVLGGFFPIAAYIVVIGISVWWILPAILFRKDRQKKSL